MQEKQSLQSLPDDELLRRLAALVGQSRRVEADIVAHIAEVDGRGLYARQAFPSMFVYVKNVLHLSEPEAYLRIAVARASREHPMLLALLADGRLHLTAIGLLAPHLTRENRDGLLARATHKSKRQIEELIAEIAPRPDVAAVVRKLPERRTRPTPGLLAVPNRGEDPVLELGRDVFLFPDSVAGAERENGPGLELGPDETLLRPDRVVPPPVVVPQLSPSVVQPLSPGRYKVQFTASAELRHKLERLRALIGVPDGDLAAVIEQAVTEKLERLEARRFSQTKARRQGPTDAKPQGSPELDATDAAPSPSSRPIPARTQETRPRTSSRYIPAAVRRAVYQRDGGRCGYVDDQGRRCPERDRLEFHHRHPFALGGGPDVANVRLMCRAHNAYLAECDYGRKTMARHRRPPGPPSSAPPG